MNSSWRGCSHEDERKFNKFSIVASKIFSFLQRIFSPSNYALVIATSAKSLLVTIVANNVLSINSHCA